MRVPTRIPLAGKMVKVRYPEIVEDNDFAMVDTDTLTIDVSTTRNTSAVDGWKSIFHELSHISLALSGHCQWLAEPQEEAIVHALEHLLGPVLVLAPLKGICWRNVAFAFEE